MSAQRLGPRAAAGLTDERGSSFATTLDRCGSCLTASTAGWQYGQLLAPTDPLYRAASGACLAAIVLMQVANVWLCRSARGALFAGNGRPSPLLYWGIGFELLLLAAILYTPSGNALFGTAPLAADVWWFMLPFPLAMLALETARKAVARWWWPAGRSAGGS